MIMGDNFRR